MLEISNYVEHNHQELIEYYKQTKSATITGQKYNISSAAVYKILKINNIQRVGWFGRITRNIKELDANLILTEYNKCKSAFKVSKMFNLNERALRRLLKKMGVIFFHKGNKGRCKYQENIPQAIKMYHEGATLKFIKKQLRINPETFVKILQQHNIPFIPQTDRSGPGLFLIKKNLPEIIKLYSQNHNINITAKTFGIHPGVLGTYIRKNKLNIGIGRTQQYISDRQHKDQIYQLYVKERWPLATIAKHINISRYRVKAVLKENWGDKIIRPAGEVISECLRNRLDHPHKWLSAYKNYTLPSGKTVPLQGYEPHFLDYVFKYSNIVEEEFQWLPKLQVPLSRTKQSSYGNYYPDFFLPKYNLVIEIKSTYTFKLNVYLNKRKIRKTKEAGYKFLMIKDKKYSKFHKWLKENNLLKPHEG